MSDQNEENQDWLTVKQLIERLHDEPTDAYVAFLKYSALPLGERSLERIAKTERITMNKLKDWYGRYDWADRTELLEGARWRQNWNQRQEIDSQENQRYAKKNRELKDRALRVSDKLLTVGEKLLDDAVVAGDIKETDYVETKDGRRVALTTQVFMKSKVGDIPRLFTTAIDVVRKVNDLPTEAIDPTKILPVGRKLTEYTDDELNELSEENARRAKLLSGAIKHDGPQDTVN